MQNKDKIKNKINIPKLKKKIKKNITKNKINIPKYVLDGNQNIPEGVKIVKDYFNNCGNPLYEVCLVGQKELLSEDLQKMDYKGLQFISTLGSLTEENIRQYFFWLPTNVLKSFFFINRLISNPENDFNKTNLGIHVLSLVPKKEIEELNNLGYGLTSWDSLDVYISR